MQEGIAFSFPSAITKTMYVTTFYCTLVLGSSTNPEDFRKDDSKAWLNAARDNRADAAQDDPWQFWRVQLKDT